MNSAQFRRDFPEFGSEAVYPTAAVNLWLNLSNQLLNAPPWDNTPGLIGNPGVNQSLVWAGNVVTVTTPSPHGLVGFSDLTIAGAVPAAYNGTFFATVTGPSTLTYPLPLTADPGAATTVGTYQQATNSVLDVAKELFAAHMLTLNKQAMDAASTGATPGQQVGPVASKSVGPVSVSFDVGNAIMQGAAFWNLTTYGTRFYFFADLMGAGPSQIGIGCDINGVLGFNGPAWFGPWPFPSQTGFA